MLEEYIANEYLRFFVMLVLSFVVLRLFVWFVEKIIVKLTVKTKSDLDDLILKKTSKPLTALVVLVGFLISINELSFPVEAQTLITRIIYSLILVFAFHIAYVITTLVLGRVSKKVSRKKNEAMRGLTEGFFKVVFVIAAFLVILSYWGLEIGPLLAGIGIGGVAIAFALQSSLANIFGGISIILDKSVNVDDLVTVEGVSGKIMKIGLRSTKIKTFDNEIVIVPNSKLADGNIQNIAQPNPMVRVVVPFGVAYGTDINKVKNLVLKEIKKIQGIKNPDDAHVKFLEMADSSLNFKAYFYVETFDIRLSALDEANTRIYNSLNKAGIEIPFPQIDVNLKK